MDQAYLSPPIARDVCKLFKTNAPQDGVTAYDCFGVPESADDTAIKKSIADRTQLLGSYEEEYRQRGDNNSALRVNHLRGVFSLVATAFSSPDARQKYDKLVTDARLKKFQQAVTPLLTPGREPTPDENERLLRVADDFRLEKQKAGQFILELLGVTRAGNEYARLGVIRFANDPTWPTHFDLLLLSEDTRDQGLIRAQRDTQMAKVQKLKQSPEQDDKRVARTIEERIGEAVAVLVDDGRRQSYLNEIHNRRVQKFREEVVLYVPRGARPDIDTVLQLIDLGQGLRMPEEHVRDEIKRLTGFSEFMSLIAERKRPLLGSPDSVSFHINHPQNDQELTQTIVISNDGAGQLSGTVRSTESWITVTPETIDTVASQTLTIRIDPSHLKPSIPSAATVEINSNGGIRRITITAMLADTGVTSVRSDKIAAAIAYAAGSFTIGIAPVIMFFHYEKRSAYVAAQAAQSSVLSVAAGLVLMCSSIFNDVCLLRLVARPVMYLAGAVLVGSFFLCIPAGMGKRIQLPYVYDYTQRFLRQRVPKR